MEARTEGTGLIFDVKRFSLHDGPGIRTTIFFQGCPLRCAWCQNPESQPGAPRLFRAGAKCLGCRACAAACTQNAVQFSDDGRKWLADRCLRCGACSRICPSGALSLVGTFETAANLERTVLRDRAFYAKSGGGLTLSGGEPLAQPAFAARSCTAATTRASTPHSIPRPTRLGPRWPDCFLTPILSCSTSRLSTPIGTAG